MADGTAVATSSQDWARVVARLLDGDRLAFLEINRLITRFLVHLHAYDLREDWDDLRQEVLLSLVASARAGRLRDADKLVAYIRIITRNKFIDRLGRGGRRPAQPLSSLDEDHDRHDGRRAAAAAGEGSDRVDLWLAVGDLPTQHQKVVIGVYGDGKTYQEVADETGIPFGTVKRRLREALAVLRERLGDEGRP